VKTLAPYKFDLSLLRHLVVVLFCALSLARGDGAHAQYSPPDDSKIPEAWKLSTRISFDVRSRYQNTKQSNRSEGEALTTRFQFAGEVDLPRDTILLAEIEGNLALVDQFDDGTQNRSDLPFIPDPDGLELNRLAIISEAIENVRITAGRQRIALDDWRFIGAFPFRQNDQTYDAIRVETTALGPGTLDVGYIGRVLRPLGENNPEGQFSGDSVFANYNVATPVGRFTAYHYRLDIETDEPTQRRNINSNRVTGGRLFGRRHWDEFGLIWDFAYAKQVDHAENPRDFETDYTLAELTVEPGSSGITLRAENLGSGDGQGFQTPLGSLHRFQGLADQFLRTPDEGVQDISLLARHEFSKVGVFDSVRVFARHHWFRADASDAKYGTEWNASISGQYENIILSLEYADYHADTFSTDTRSLFLTTQLRF
jgi:hypothetical protein